MSELTKWYLRTQDETFGPETQEKLISWARLGRIQPGQEISSDNIEWKRVEDVPFLDMRFSIDIGDGNPRGPFNKAAAEALLASGRLPRTSTIVEVREPFATEVEEEPVAEAAPIVEQPIESVSEEASPEIPTNDVRSEVVEKIVEVPVEKIVEKIVEKRVEVPVEKIVEKIVVDETRVKELEGMLEEERRHTADLQKRLDDVSRNAAEAAKAATQHENELRAEISAQHETVTSFEAAIKDATDRENKYIEQIKNLEDELRRLPQAASEVADIQAAVFSIISQEAADLEHALDVEKKEFEDAKKRFESRAERLRERRHDLLKRTGSNIEEMTRKALINRPEDPRAAQIRSEFEEFRRTKEREALDREACIRDLTERLNLQEAEYKRAAQNQRDTVQLLSDIASLQAKLQTREKELLEERQRNEEMMRQQAVRQQVLAARLSQLESPSIGTSGTIATNQSREARQVKLPRWMSLRK